MNLLLYFRVQHYDVRPCSNGTYSSPYHSRILCDMNPICVVTVKGLMLDYPNHYILNSLAILIDHTLDISHSWQWLTPNAISGFHVLVAVIASRYIMQNSLSRRRLGVFLFVIRTLLDNLDGHVARKRLNIEGQKSDFHSIGYFVDGVCDGLGCIALIIAIFVFLARNANRYADYNVLPRTVPSFEDNINSTKISFWKTSLQNLLFVSIHLILTTTAWNYYISAYQDALETDNEFHTINQKELCNRQTNIFRSTTFWAIIFVWKLVNFHALIDYMLLAIFLDRIWEYVRLIRWSAYITILGLIFVTEFHFLYIYNYLHDT